MRYSLPAHSAPTSFANPDNSSDSGSLPHGTVPSTPSITCGTYAEGDTSHVIAPNVETFRSELARLYQYRPQAPAFICIDPEAGVVTSHFEAKPEV